MIRTTLANNKISMVRFSLCLLLCFLALTANVSAYADEAVLVAVNEDIPADYKRFLHGRDPVDVQAFNTDGARRDIVEITLLMQALRLGGFTKPVELRVEPSYLRLLRGVADGRFVSSGALMWKSDIDMLKPALHVSRPLVKEGEFVVGVYTTQKKLQRVTNYAPYNLNQLNIVTNSQWKSDVQTLKDLGFNRITYSPNWVNIARMIEAGRADITLAPFQTTPQMTIAVDDVTLYPIKGVKVAISGSRHWPISRKHPYGEEFFQALERGLALLESKGTIARAYRECGFFHPDVGPWTLLAR
ncbi:hypothetical protein GCM10011613_28400 [Cellvibrio zantedeschiae]|uniref:Solute-binding protein family 3/N-terminal domain-containing protein n=1 Tax=Cellvibrio zantedeschiae TaxID=1237077 RepID=A0ABQ3B7I2_9GAMM|nr:hypothetical protein [Cellvibrio zantedeschiae]GGY82017.1 hypothetical protein GCM10011613_28400 [Cellvibrio zantedeschiae]